MITPEELAAALKYEPESGKLFWKAPTGSMARGPVGSIYSEGYLRVRFKQNSLTAHRIAWAIHYGEWPAGWIDHINGVRDDNRIVNLRSASAAQNCQNSVIRSSNKSGFKGVSKRRNCDRWRATLWTVENGKRKQIALGHFASAAEAHEAYVVAAKRVFGEFAHS